MWFRWPASLPQQCDEIAFGLIPDIEFILLATDAIVSANSTRYSVRLPMRRYLPLIIRTCLPTLLFGLAIGCSGIEKAKPTPKEAKADRSFLIDVPEIMRGTIASETVVLGYEAQTSSGYSPIVARGYGLVVGLHGNGSRDMAPQLRAFMLAQAAKYGVGNARYGDPNSRMTPQQLLDSGDTAVVVVEAVVPQGAVRGTRFDVRVAADPLSGATVSLEGGTLWTTELRPGSPTIGGTQAAPLAEAHGPVFVNPFAEPGAIGKDTVVRTAGRILNGGSVIKDMPLKLRLANPSHARAAILQTAINSRFVQEPRQKEQTAHGESDEVIRINVPPSFADRTDEFIELLRHTSIAQANPELIAMSIRQLVLANPLVAKAASLRWQALGRRVLPIIKDLYDYPEEQPRLAALRAGAKLDDALVIPHLFDMASHASPDARIKAIQLLADMQANPLIDQTLRALLDDEDIEVRLEAYEALAKRDDPYMRRYTVDGKFILDVVESHKPMIYITQTGQPRIAVFDRKLAIDRPAMISTWSDTFMVKADSENDPLEVFYRAPGNEQGVILKADPELERFVQFLGHTTTIEKPAPGLGMTYCETVGLLYHIWNQKYVKADFKAEQDRILAAIARVRDESDVPDRPEFTSIAKPDDSGAKTDFGPTSDLGKLQRDAPPMPSGAFDPVAPKPETPPTNPQK